MFRYFKNYRKCSVIRLEADSQKNSVHIIRKVWFCIICSAMLFDIILTKSLHSQWIFLRKMHTEVYFFSCYSTLSEMFCNKIRNRFAKTLRTYNQKILILYSLLCNVISHYLIKIFAFAMNFCKKNVYWSILSILPCSLKS